MINQITLYACFSATMLMQAMNDPRFQRVQDPNMALICATASMANGYFDQKVFAEAEFLLENGADSNFASPIFGVTPLMRSVRANSREVVELLLKKGARVNISNPDGKFVRDFNLIYSRKKIVPIVTYITNYMLQIEKYNAQNPQKKINCRETICSMKRSHILRNAVSIDKILEKHKAYSDVLPYRHPLLKMLRDSRVRRALSYVFTYHMNDLPYALKTMLCNNQVPRAASVPGLFLT